MATWHEFEMAAPDLAARAGTLLQSRKHKTIATVRADGSPRISGIETEIVDGQLTFGSMPDSRKGNDLLRDPRFALHGPTSDPAGDTGQDWVGEAKVSGIALTTGPLGGDGPDGIGFRADLTSVTITALNAAGTALLIETWTPAGGVVTVERA